MSNYNLTGQKIKDTYTQVAQVNANRLVNGVGVATPIATSSIVNFPTEVSRSAAAAGFGQGGGGGVSEATFGAYTSSNNANVSNLTTRVNSLTSVTSSYALKTQVSGAFTSTSASLSSRVTTNTGNISTNTTRIGTLTAATSSYALKTDISGAFNINTVENAVGTKAYLNVPGITASTTFMLTQPTIGSGVGYQQASDQNNNTAILSRFFPNAGKAITEWVIPIFANGFTGNYDLEVAVYDVRFDTNEPRTKIFSTPLTIPLVGSDVYHNHIFISPFIPPSPNLWIAIQSTNSGTDNVKVGVLNNPHMCVSSRIITFGNPPGQGEIRGVNSFYYTDGDLPSTIPINQSYQQGRDECLVIGYR